MTPRYLDHAATSPLRPEVLGAMVPVLRDLHGNPSGGHGPARAARAALEEARDRLAAVAGCAAGEVVFTSGGTEADDLALRGTVAARPGTPVCSATEHHAVLDVVGRLGGPVVEVDRRGLLDLDHLARTLSQAAPVAVVSVHLVNNETGVVQDLDAVAEVVARHAPGAVLHTDAAQALSWLDVAAATARADLVTLASHKCGGPKGVGALVVRDGRAIEPRLLGGGQERGRRAGTPDVAGAVGFAAAAELARVERSDLVARAGAWRARLVAALVAEVPDLVVTAAPTGSGLDHAAPGWVHVCVPGVRSEPLLFLLDDEHGVAASAASSCASGAQERSHVLAAMGVDPQAAAGSLRLTLGWSTTGADVEAVASAVPAAVARLRAAARHGVAV
ncbi:MAG: cysteine desulfurase family protein [Acidimicrobiia bacterium]